MHPVSRTTQPPSYRLGSTSYVYPADLVTNVQKLAGVVRDMEVVLFELPTGESNFGDLAQVEEMAAVGAAHDMTFTVHLPLDLYGGRDSKAFQVAERVIELTTPLSPYGYVFHIEHRTPGRAEWYEAGRQAIEALLLLVDSPHRLCLENLESYPLDLLEPFFAEYPIARTLDIGHLWKAGLDPFSYIERWLPTTRVIHLHGVRREVERVVDHLSLAVMEPNEVSQVLMALKGYNGVLTLEVFEGDFWTSYARVDDFRSPP
jgi:sugar phosphate isomerase/epimerase